MKSKIQNQQSKMAFTLVELLVVITIVVVLLALLVPALDKAIYQSELVVCGAKLKAVGRGIVQYAMDHKRRYPHRPAVEAGSGFRPDYLYTKLTASPATSYDDRRAIRPYIALNPMLNCPLSQAVDLEYAHPTMDMIIYTNYELWYGWRYGRSGAGLPGMRKMGERFEWDGSRFDVLAADSDTIDEGAWLAVAHPDDSQKVYPEVYFNRLTPAYRVTSSFWVNRDAVSRGKVDRNFLHDDGSVRRIAGLALDDPRLIVVPDRAQGSEFPNRRRWLPRAE